MSVFEINLARRVIERFSLKPPIDVFNIARKYATVEYDVLPVDIDGACLDLKVKGKKPLIVLNKFQRSARRVRFTLAHELGHVLIPWHEGDLIDVQIFELSSPFEAEANRFASELLMPTNWIVEKVNNLDNPIELIREITNEADVSHQSATIKVVNYFPPGYLFAILDDDGYVRNSGQSSGSNAMAPKTGTYIQNQNNLYQDAEFWSHKTSSGIEHCWWKIPEWKPALIPPVNILSTEQRDWRAILDEILNDLEQQGIDKKWLRMSINGMVGAVNNLDLREMSLDQANGQLLHRIFRRTDNDAYKAFVEHPKMNDFVVKRMEELLKKTTQ